MVGLRNLMLVGALAITPLLLTACQSARAGIGQPRTFLYKNVTTPFTIKRDRAAGPPQGLQIPENLVAGRSRFYYIGIPLMGAGIPTPGLTPLSVGWGNGSLEASMADGDIREVIYGDAQEIEILGIFNKVILTVYGEPRGEDAEAVR